MQLRAVSFIQTDFLTYLPDSLTQKFLVCSGLEFFLLVRLVGVSHLSVNKSHATTCN